MTDDGNRPHRFSKGQGFNENYSDFSFDPPELSVGPTKVDPVDSCVLTDILDQRNIDPEDVGVEELLNMALSYMQINRSEEATGAFERVARYAGDDDNIVQRAWVNKGATYNQLEEWDEATDSYREALKLDDDSEHAAMAHTNLAYALWEADQTADTPNHAEHAVGFDPHFPQAWYNRGFFLHEHGLNEDAVGTFDNAIHLGMRIPGVHEEKARALEGLERNEEAKQAQQQVSNLHEQAEAELIEEHQMLLHERKTPEGLLVSICNPGCIGETYTDDGISLDMMEGFYGDGEAETVDEGAVVDSLTRATVANIVGEGSVLVAVDVGLVDEETVLEVDGTLHAQLLWLH